MARNFIVIYLYNTFHSIIALFKDDVIQFCRNADVRLVRVTKSARNVFCIPTCHTIGADSEVASGPKADCPSRRCASCACFDLRRLPSAEIRYRSSARYGGAMPCRTGRPTAVKRLSCFSQSQPVSAVYAKLLL